MDFLPALLFRIGKLVSEESNSQPGILLLAVRLNHYLIIR